MHTGPAPSIFDAAAQHLRSAVVAYRSALSVEAAARAPGTLQEARKATEATYGALRVLVRDGFEQTDPMLKSLRARRSAATELASAAESAIGALHQQLKPLIGQVAAGDRARLDAVVATINGHIAAVNERLTALSALDQRVLTLGDLPLPGVAREDKVLPQLKAVIAFADRDHLNALRLTERRLDDLTAHIARQVN